MSAHPYSAAALRLGAWHFLTGKAASGLLTFAILLTLVRLLPVADYGAYVSLVAAAELSYALGGLGLTWAGARFLPEYRLQSARAVTAALAWRLLRWQAGALLILATLAVLSLPLLLPELGIDAPLVASLAWVGLILAEGCGRFLREGLLGPLLQQECIRASLVLRQGLFLVVIAVLAARGEATLSHVLLAEVCASVLAAFVALAGLMRHLRALPAPAGSPALAPPAVRALWRVALPMYAGHLLTLAYGPQVCLLLLQRFAGAEAAAVFGFLRNLYEQAARYLPATLMFGLVRPKLVASFAGGGGMAELTRNANLAGKLSLFVLMPALGFAAVGGDTLIALLSGGLFPQTEWLFFGFLLALVPFSQRQLLETVAVTAGRARLCTLGAAAGLPMPLLMIVLLEAGAGFWAGVVALLGGHLTFAVVLVRGLRSAGYRPDTLGLAKLALGAAAGGALAALLPKMSPAWFELAALASAACAAFLAVAWFAKPFADTERDRLNDLLGRRLFRG